MVTCTFSSETAICLFSQLLYSSSSNRKHFKPRTKCWGQPCSASF